MAQPPGDGSLADQMAALQKRVDRREKRRASDRRERSLGSDYDGFRSTYDDGPQHNQPKRRAANATGGLPLGSAAAAVAAAGALAGPTLQRCELCAATFGSERELALHLEGAAHRQAVARMEAEAERRRRLGAYADVAASAVQAAVWQSGGSGGRPAQRPPAPSAAAATGGNAMALGGSGVGAPAPQQQHGGRGGGGRGRGGGPQQQQQGRGRGQPPQQAAPAVHARDLTSHKEMLKQARGGDKAPLDLDGWVPPTVPQPAAAVPAAPAEARGQQEGQPLQAAAGGSEQQAEAEQQAGLLGKLVSYGEADSEGEAVGQDGGAPLKQQAQQQEASSGSEGSSTDSDSEGGGGAPAAFFSF